jgi:uncharacterized protein (TIGR02646 family)
MRSFADAEASYLAELRGAASKTEFARSEFDRLDKKKLRAVMYDEQGSLCAYCERTIGESDPNPRIDHWKPLSLNHSEAIHWKNLYLSCPSRETCDDAKGNRPLKWDENDADLPWPADFDYERHVGFTSRGEMYVRNDTGLTETVRKALKLAIEDQFDGNEIRPALLNLNHPSLVAARAAALDSERMRLKKQFRGRTAKMEDRQQRVEDLTSANTLSSFISIRVAWLQKRLGKGR